MRGSWESESGIVPELLRRRQWRSVTSSSLAEHEGGKKPIGSCRRDKREFEDCVDGEKKNKRDGYEGDSGGSSDTDTRVGRHGR